MDETNMPGNPPEPQSEGQFKPEPVIEAKKEERKSQKKSITFWLAIILGALLLLSTGVNIVLSIVVTANMIEPPQSTIAPIGNEKFVHGDKHSKNKILLISVNGIILEQSDDSPFYNKKGILETIKDAFAKAEEDSNIKAIVLSVNSPGGGITECDEIHHEIMKFKAKKQIPIVVSMQDLAASGGYYISAPAQKIFAQPTTLTGSIGVIMEFTNIEGLFTKIGLESVTIKSGKLKDIASPTRDMTKEENELLNKMVGEMSQRFFKVVREGRKNITDEQFKVISDARIFTAHQAKDIGLVDEIGYLDDAFNAARDLAGIKDAKLIKIKQNITFFDLFSETARHLNPQSKIDEQIKTLVPTNPRLMYIWRE